MAPREWSTSTSSIASAALAAASAVWDFTFLADRLRAEVDLRLRWWEDAESIAGSNDEGRAPEVMGMWCAGVVVAVTAAVDDDDDEES